MNIIEKIDNVFRREGVKKPPSGGVYSEENSAWDNTLWSAMKHGTHNPSAAAAALWAMTKNRMGGGLTPPMEAGNIVSAADKEAALLFWEQGEHMESFAEARDASHAVYSAPYRQIAQRVGTNVLTAFKRNGMTAITDISANYPLDRKKIAAYLPTFTATDGAVSETRFRMREKMFGGDSPPFKWTSKWSDDGLQLHIIIGRKSWMAERIMRMVGMASPPIIAVADFTLVFDPNPSGPATMKIKKYDEADKLIGKAVSLMTHLSLKFGGRTTIKFGDKPPAKLMDFMQMHAVLDMRYPKTHGNTMTYGRANDNKSYVPRVLYGAAPVVVQQFPDEIILIANSPDNKKWRVPLDKHGRRLYGTIRTYNTYGTVNPKEYAALRNETPPNHPAAAVRFIGITENMR